MIKVYVNNNTFTIKGHALYDTIGKDIVCASVSSIVTTSINALVRFDKDSIKYYNENDSLIIEILKNNKETNILVENMLSLLKELEEDYPKNIKIIKED